MALIKNVVLNDIGIEADYWKVKSVVVDNVRKEASFTILLFTKKGMTRHVKEVVVSDLMGLEDKTLYDEYFGTGLVNFKDIYTACYEYAKKYVDLFKDASDDEDELNK